METIVIVDDDEIMHDYEGIIFCDPNGEEHENQAGGVACWHPTTRGFFSPWSVPQEVKDLMEDEHGATLRESVVAAVQPHVPWPIIPERSYGEVVRGVAARADRRRRRGRDRVGEQRLMTAFRFEVYPW